MMLVALSVLIATTPPARLTAEVRRTAERIDAISALVNERNWDESLREYLRLIDDAGDELIFKPGACSSVTVREFIFDRIAGQSELLQRFRNRFESSMQAALNEATAKRDAEALRRIVRDGRPTRAAESARNFLGDIAFERGNFALAQHQWSSRTDVGGQAKSLLATIFLGESTDDALSKFESVAGEAGGWLAGRQGKFAATLRLVADEQSSHRQRDPQAPRFSARLLGVNDWDGNAIDDADTRIEQRRTTSTRQPLRTPIFWSNRLIVRDGDRLAAYELQTGRLIHYLELQQSSDKPVAGLTPPVVSGEFLYIPAGSAIVQLQHIGDGADWRMNEVARINASKLPNPEAAEFVGEPIITGDHLFAAWSQTIGSRRIVSLACFDRSNLNDAPIWAHSIAEITIEATGPPPQFRLAASNDIIVMTTDAGVVVGIDAVTGRSLWAFRYSRLGPRSMSAEFNPRPRESIAPVIDAGRVFVAPADTHQLFALNLWIGEPIWPRPVPLECVHLLGVIDGKLIVTADGLLRGIGAIDVHRGHFIPDWGSLSSIPPHGRGAIINDRVLFPTQHDGLKIIDREGRIVYSPTVFQNLTGGNIARAAKFLVVADNDRCVRFEVP